MSSKNFAAIFPLFLVIFLDGMGISILFPILNEIIMSPAESILPFNTSLNAREIYYTITLSAFFLCWFFGTAIVSDLSDKIGRKKALLICLAGSMLGYVFVALAVIFKSFTLLLLGRVIDGFTLGSQPIAQAAIMDISTRETKARNLSWIMLAASLGFVFGPLAGGVLADKNLISWFNPAIPMDFAALLSLLNIIFLIFAFKDTRPGTGQWKLNFKYAITIFVDAFTHESIRKLSIIFLVMVLGWASFFNFIALFLYQRYQLDLLHTALYMALLGLGFGLASAFFTGFFTARFSLYRVMSVGAVLTGLGFLVIALTPLQSIAWVMSTFVGASGMVTYTVILNIFSNQVDAERQGWVMGITSAVTAFAFSVAAIFEGPVIAVAPAAPMLIAAIGMILSGILLALHHRRETSV